MKYLNLTKFFMLICSMSTLSSCNPSGGGSSKTYEKIVISKADGYKIKFNNIGAAYYKVFDNNDYRNQIIISGNRVDEYFYYEPEVVGKHTVYVEAYNNKDQRVKFSDDFETMEVEPVLSYSPFAMHYVATKNDLSILGIPLSVWNDAEARYGTSDQHYFYLDKDLNWTARGALSEGDKSGKYDIVEELDFSKNNILDKAMKNLKEAGNNVILLHEKYAFLERNVGWCWWYKSDSDNCLLRIMNTAWKYGMKCIITDSAIMSVCSRGTGKYTGNLDTLKNEVQSVVNSRLMHLVSTESNAQTFLAHKAFYGFNFPDEPIYESATYYAIGYASQKINELYGPTGALKKLTKPVVFTSLNPYATFLFSGKSEYKQYIQKYLDLTQSNFVAFDLYTYTTMSYGTNFFGQYHCNVKIAFESYYEIMKENRDVKVLQTINCGNIKDMKKQTYADIYASHLLTVGSGYFGYALFTFSPFDVVGSWVNPAVDMKQERTEYYPYFVDANKQALIVKGLLQGYLLDSLSVEQTSLLGIPSEYGYGKKLLTSIFKKGDKEAKMYVNFETDIANVNNVDYQITVSSGHSYYLFGRNKNGTVNVANGDVTITLTKAEGLLVI